MLETIRQFGAERLAEAGETDRLRRRHRDHYLRLARLANAESCGPLLKTWVERLRVDRDNLWSALDYCVQTPARAWPRSA